MSESRNSSKIFVGRISTQTTTKTIEREFQKYGKIKDIDMRSHYAFIQYSDSRDAQEAIRHLDGKYIDGSRLRVERAEGKQLDRYSERKGDRTDRRDRDKDRERDRDKDRGDRFNREERGERRGPSSSDRCFNCNKLGHWANQCRESKSIRCYRCNERGHMKRNCNLSRTPSPNRRGPRNEKKSSRSRSRSRSHSRSNSVHSNQNRSPSIKSNQESKNPSHSPTNPQENVNEIKKSPSKSPSHEQEQVRTPSQSNEIKASPMPTKEEYDYQFALQKHNLIMRHSH